jgi:hypothetical protein
LRGPFPTVPLQLLDPPPLTFGQPPAGHGAALTRRGLPRIRPGRSTRIDLN